MPQFPQRQLRRERELSLFLRLVCHGFERRDFWESVKRCNVGVMGDRALTSCPPLGTWQEVEGSFVWGSVLKVSARSWVRQEAAWPGWCQAVSSEERKDALLVLARTAMP